MSQPALIDLVSDCFHFVLPVQFHFVLPVQIKIFNAQEFTESFALIKFPAQRANFWLVDFQ